MVPLLVLQMLVAAAGAAGLARAGVPPDDEVGAYGSLVVTACDHSAFGDPGQRFVYDKSSGQLSTTFGTGGTKCVAVADCGLQPNGQVVLTSCMDTKCTAWGLKKPPHPVPSANDTATWLVAPGSPTDQPRCLENPKRTSQGQLDIFCCSGETADCASVYKTALPWQQWSLESNGQVRNLAGDGALCMTATPPPPPPLEAAPVWPLPQYLHCQPSQGFRPLLSDSVVVTVAGSTSVVVNEVVRRFTPLLRSAGTSDGHVQRIAIALQSGSEVLGQTTNYSYSLSYVAMTSNVVTGTAASPHGVGYSLETLLQLAEPAASAQCGSAFEVRDFPSYVHRGLMIDTGRRFYSVELVESLLEGMSMMKMNVMHMFLSELCFRVESKVFPDLVNNGGLNCTGPKPVPGLVNNGYYTQADIARLVEFARLRGIRVIPEFDMPGLTPQMYKHPLPPALANPAFLFFLPGHSGGFCHGLRSAGIKCCTNGGMGVPQIEDDPDGVSAGLVKKLLHEMAGLFPDSVLHIGGDETGSTPPCTLANTKSWEVKIIEYVQNSLKKEVMGWEEVVFKTGAASGNSDVIVDSWARSSWQQAAARDHRTVASNSGNLYLDIHSSVASHQWVDLRGGTTNNTLLSKLLGAETSMWQDFYVPGARTKEAGSAKCLFDDSRDSDFDNSTSSTVWPRAAVAAGAFWHYSSALDATAGSDTVFEGVVSDIKRRLAARGIGVCPCATGTSLGCAQNNYCGHVWCPDG